VTKRSNGAGKASAPKRGDGLGGAGIHRQESLLIRGPHWMIELIDDATEHSNCETRQEWLRTSLIIQAAEELGLNPVAALAGRREPA
jgi:hypothetical protein